MCLCPKLGVKNTLLQIVFSSISLRSIAIYSCKVQLKNAGHEMAIVGEPCNVDAHAKIPALFITMFCPLCAHDVCTHVLYNCTHWLWLFRCLVDHSEQRIHPGDTTQDKHTTHPDRVKFWARVPRLKDIRFVHKGVHYYQTKVCGVLLYPQIRFSPCYFFKWKIALEFSTSCLSLP